MNAKFSQRHTLSMAVLVSVLGFAVCITGSASGPEKDGAQVTKRNS